uniref:Uncharacterized protein n=1 Tax=Pseudonaja textilis TaxID=8673 RepID=A0A670Y548_PSETE
MVGFKPSDVPPTATIKFLGAGTAACIADLITFPLDMAKVWLQIQEEKKSHVTPKMAQYRGSLSLYNGLVASLQRQMSFASVRIRLYDSVKHFYTKGSEHAGVGSWLLAGCTTGVMAVVVAQPMEVVKVRFQAQIWTDAGQSYQGTLHANKTIAKEGVQGLWKGTLPNISQNTIVNCAELVTYDIIKDSLLKSHLMTDDIPSRHSLNFCSHPISPFSARF